MAKKDKVICKCYDCKFSYLMRSSEANPIVSECIKTQERQVADTPHTCDLFKINESGNHSINKMKFL